MKIDKKTLSRLMVLFAMLFIFSLVGEYMLEKEMEAQEPAASQSQTMPAEEETIPDYSGEPYYILNGNQPFFTEEEITAEAFEEFGELDELGRCGVVMACVG